MREVLYRDCSGYVSCDFLFNRTKVALHLYLNPDQWSVEKFKKYRSIFDNTILPELKARGYNEVYATPFENDLKAQKLIKMFGLRQYNCNMGLVLMKREI